MLHNPKKKAARRFGGYDLPPARALPQSPPQLSEELRRGVPPAKRAAVQLGAQMIKP